MNRKLKEFRELLDPFLTVSVPADNGDFEAFCPAHENPSSSKKPSANINFTPQNKRMYPYGMIHCFVCGFEGQDCRLERIVEVYESRIAAGVQFGSTDKTERTHQFNVAGSKKHKFPSFMTRREYKQALLEDPKLMRYLRTVRGLNLETIKKFGIGWISSRHAYCYPVYKDGHIFALRMYRPTDKKIKHSWYNSEDPHDPQLHGIEGMEDQPVVILTEGEFDMYLARQDGFKAVTHNGGAAKWESRWSPWFKDKVVYIAYDADKAGRIGRVKVARAIKSFARAVYFVDFPGPNGTDYTDFRIRDGRTAEDFQALLDEAKGRMPETENVSKEGLPLVGKQVTLAQANASSLVNVPLELKVQVLGRLDPPYSIPSKVELECTMDKGEKYCSVCPMGGTGHMTLEITKDSEFIQRAVGVRDSEIDTLILKESGVRCKDKITDIDKAERWTVEEVAVNESVETRDEGQESHMLAKTDMTKAIFVIDSWDSEVNEIYRVVGTQRPRPRDQKLQYTAWHREQTKTNIDQFKMDEDIYEQLKIFQPAAHGQSVYQKMRAIARDLTANVVGIVDRVDLAMAYDVAWHSALSFYFGGKLDERGWVELLVFGDTRTGKSETAHRLAAWYRNGKIFSSEGATRAGLVGGATQPQGTKHWIATWGAIPQNDRRLIVLDEAQALVDIVKDMGSIRSKGVAEMVKVGINQSTLARTRLIWICNPLTQGKLNEMVDGAMTALAEFMPASEDRARFDLAVALSQDDVTSDEIHRGIKKEHKTPEYPSEACEKLILWAWSRRPDQIRIDKSVESYILSMSKDIVEKYDRGNFELVQHSNMHVKLARITVACAARVFSTDETGEELIVKNLHVDAAKKIIEELYDNPVLGLGRASARAKVASEHAEANSDMVKEWLRTGKSKQGALPNFGIETYRALRSSSGRFKNRIFAEVSGLDQRDAADVISFLVELSMLKHNTTNGDVVVTKELMEVLRDMESESNG